MANPDSEETHNTISGGTFNAPVLQGGHFVNPTFVTARAPATPPVLDQLPALVTGFTGRQTELAQIAELLNPVGGAQAVVVAGMAGMGKTALAVHAAYAARAAGWFTGGVLFIDLHGYDSSPVQPGQALDALLRALEQPPERIPEGVEQRAALYRSVLAKTPNAIQIVIDNASSEGQVRLLVPGTGPHRVIITSRHTLATLGARLVEVNELDQAAAVELLDRAVRAVRPDESRISSDEDAAQRLATTCAGLPLALQITAALLAVDPALSAAELANEMTDEVRRLETLRYDDGSGISAPSVAAAFELSYRHLDSDAARTFRLLPADPGLDVSTDAVAALANWTADRARAALGRLTRAHLVEPAAGVPGRWRMHDLLRLYARQLLEEDERDRAIDRVTSWYLENTRAADHHLHALPPDTVVAAEFLGRDDALAWLDANRLNLLGIVTMAAGTGRDLVAMDLPFHLIEYLLWRRRFDDLVTALTTSRDIAQRLGNQTNEISALNSLGVALRETGRLHEAVSAHQAAIAYYRKVGDTHSLGEALGNLGVALRTAGRFDEAIRVLEEADEIFREVGDKRDLSKTLINLGAALMGTGGSTDEAISVLQEAVEICREIEDEHGLGMALGNLGVALQETERSGEAISAFRSAAGIFRKTGDRHSVGMSMHNLGTALREAGKPEQAISALQEAVESYRETGDEHALGVALGSLGATLVEVGRPEEAIGVLQKAAAAARKARDERGRAAIWANLAKALEDTAGLTRRPASFKKQLQFSRKPATCHVLKT